MSTRVYIGLGSNLQDPAQQIQSARVELGELAIDAKIDMSPVYITQPVGPQDQPDYYNAVARFDTELEAQDLLNQLFTIEDAHQRLRNDEQWGPRTLDLDLLLYGEAIISSEQLNVPHLRLHERAFVLQPLFDLQDDLWIPGAGALVELLQKCDQSGIKQHVGQFGE